MIALWIIALVWLGSAVLVVPYLLHVAKIEAEQAMSQQPKSNLSLPSEYTGSFVADAGRLLVVGRDAVPHAPNLPAAEEAKVSIEA
jgi:hypothetical protein